MRSPWQDSPGAGDPYGGGGAGFAMPSITPIVRKLIYVNVGVFLLLWVLSLVTSPQAWHGIEEFYLFNLGLHPPGWQWIFAPPVEEGGPGGLMRWILPVWQVLTYGFLHDQSRLGHILFNMLALYFMGGMLEGIVGGRRFLSFYLQSLVFAGLVTVVVSLVMADPRPVVGASGAVLATVVALATLRPNTRVIFIIFPMTLKILAILWVFMDFFTLMNGIKADTTSQTAVVTHLAGAAFGFLAVKQGWIWVDFGERVADWKEQLEEEAREEDAEKLDELLAKISRDGLTSLSPREKAFLKKASKRSK